VRHIDSIINLGNIMIARWFVIVCLNFFCLTLAHAQSMAPLKLGIMPFNSALALTKTHQPLRQHLQNTLGRPVDIFTSTDYFTFLNEMLDGRFDIAIAGPHFGSMAMDRGWVPLFRYKAILQPVFVVRPDAGINKLDDLRGKRIGLSSRLSISSIGGVKWLQDHGLQLDKDFHLFERSTHGAAVAGVAVGEFDAALTTYTPLKQIPEDVRAKVIVLPLDISVPHLMTLAHPRLGKKEIQQIKQALLSFSARSGPGADFFRDTGYLGYEEVTAADVRALKPYVDLTLRMIGKSR
jgi:phosphonate transport system substrate-binding protein